MPPPGWVSDLDDYWRWTEQLLEHSTGTLREQTLVVLPQGTDEEELVGYRVPEQNLQLPGGSLLVFKFTVAGNMELTEYKFHLMTHDKRLVWRKDKHLGHHRAHGQLSHIHDDPADPRSCRPYKEVDLGEALTQVQTYLERDHER